MWSGGKKALVGSKGKLWECGLARENRRLGQRESPRSVVWWEKALVGSKGKPPECGLARENCRLGQRERHRSVV